WGGVFGGQGPSWRAWGAALTARSTWALSLWATWQMVSPVAGLMVGNVFPETLSSHLPPMKRAWSFTLGGFTVRPFFSTVAVAMGISSCKYRVERGSRNPK